MNFMSVNCQLSVNVHSAVEAQARHFRSVLSASEVLICLP